MERPRLSWIGDAVGFACFALILWWAAQVTSFEWGDSVSAELAIAVGAAIAGAVLVPPLATLPHELGHLIAGWILRIPVLGIRVGPFTLGLKVPRDSEAGHVLFDARHVGRGRRPRMIVMVLAGPAAEAWIPLVTYPFINDTSLPIWGRAFALGATVGATVALIGNLVPIEFLVGVVNDGHAAWSWLVGAEGQSRRTALAVDLAQLRAGSPEVADLAQRRVHIRSLVADPRPEIASEAVFAMLRAQPRGDDGWTDLESMQAYAGRADVDPATRAVLAGNYALSLGVARLRERTPDPAQVERVAGLAEAAHAASPGSLPGSTALALARLLQGRAGEARRLLVRTEADQSQLFEARALAVRALAESRLGDAAAATRLTTSAERLVPDDQIVILARRLVG